MNSLINEQTTWVVARFGAYMHYAVPRMLHRSARLERLYTDFYAGRIATQLLSLIPKRWRSSVLNRALGRSSADLPHKRVHSFPLLGLEYYLRQSHATDLEGRSEIYLSIGKKFGELVARKGFGNAGAIYVFNTAALEILAAAKKRGLFTVLEQTIAPRGLEEELLVEEHRRFPGWEPMRDHGPATTRTIEREALEWQLADLIICGSDFVRRGVGHCGGPIEKCLVVPYGVDSRFSQSNRSLGRGPLRVLCVGEVSLRKGIPYFAETARKLGNATEFRWVGPINLHRNARREVERQVHLTGAIPRNQIFAQFEWADVFFLPSICEGSATVTYEALTSGLPVIATPNTGSVVSDGINGFIVPVRDIDAMVDRVQLLHSDRKLLSKMQAAARNSTEITSLESYQQRLLRALILKGNKKANMDLIFAPSERRTGRSLFLS